MAARVDRGVDIERLERAGDRGEKQAVACIGRSKAIRAFGIFDNAARVNKDGLENSGGL